MDLMDDDTDLLYWGREGRQVAIYGVPQQKHSLSRMYGELYTLMGLN